MINTDDYKKLLDKIESNEKASALFNKLNKNEKLFYTHLKQAELLSLNISKNRLFNLSEEIYSNVTVEIKRIKGC